MESDEFAAYIPFFARYPYEAHITARRPGVTRLDQMTTQERRALASMLKRLLVGYDNLFDRSMPYIMAMHQAPVDGQDYDDIYSYHIEFYPPYRTKDKLKYLAGSESGAGAFIMDVLAEDKAKELREMLPPE